MDIPRWTRMAQGSVYAMVPVAFFWVMAVVPSFYRGCHIQAHCSSSAKRIGAAMLQYAEDYDERFPPAYVVDRGNWQNLLEPYGGSRSVFRCPSRRGADATVAYSAPGAPIPVSFAVNPRVCRKPGTGGSITFSDVKDPVHKILVGETSGVLPTMGDPEWDHGGSPFRDVAWFGHDGAANFVFCDGHMKPLRRRDMQTRQPESNRWGGFDGTAARSPQRSVNCDAYDAALEQQLR